MDRQEALHHAVRNNALWCDTVCRAQGLPGEVYPEIWLNRAETPRFYPNAVTLLGAEAADTQRAAIEELRQGGIPGTWAVKDSFRALDLAPLGFEPVFDAEWIYCPPPALGLGSYREAAQWRRIEDAEELARWEAAWAGPGAESLPRVFLPLLLADAEVSILGAYQEERVVAGAIANRTGPVVGFSNYFGPDQRAADYRAGCLAAIAGSFPGLPLVGYDRGEDLDGWIAAGFKTLGPLRVWGSADQSDAVTILMPQNEGLQLDGERFVATDVEMSRLLGWKGEVNGCSECAPRGQFVAGGGTASPRRSRLG